MIWTAPDRQSQRNGFSEQSMATEACKSNEGKWELLNENQELGFFYEKHSTFVENDEEKSKILAIETEKYMGWMVINTSNTRNSKNQKCQSRRPSSTSSSSSSSNNFKRRAYCSSLFFFCHNLKRKKENNPTATSPSKTIPTLAPVLLLEVWWAADCFPFFVLDGSSEMAEQKRKDVEYKLTILK